MEEGEGGGGVGRRKIGLRDEEVRSKGLEGGMNGGEMVE